VTTRTIPRLDRLRKSLRVRVALIVAFPVLIALTTLSYTHYRHEYQLIEEQMELAALQVGEVALGSLQHSMQRNDNQMLQQVLSDVGQMGNIHRMQIINLDRSVVADSNELDLGRIYNRDESGCKECHEDSPALQPQATILTAVDETLRITMPIDNKPACFTCHDPGNIHLGILLMDVSLADAHEHLAQNLRGDLILSIVSTLLITAGVYVLIHLLVVKRVEAHSRPLARYANGDFTSRLPSPPSPADELDELVLTFNRMADELERKAHEQESRHELRWSAIVEERERVAREIHDSLAQLMGYVNTKASAIRLLLAQDQLPEADRQLKQLTAAAGESFKDLRATILGLRTADSRGKGFEATVKELTTQLSELTEIQIDVSLPDDGLPCNLSPESELHLLRITQEALTNVRKHAATDKAWIEMKCHDHTFELTIGDQGVGFNPEDPPSDRRPRFGLSTMRERAEAIGASFHIDAEPNEGTRLTVRVPLEEPS
jgi:signal transduction histidine kinase